MQGSYRWREQPKEDRVDSKMTAVRLTVTSPSDSTIQFTATNAPYRQTPLAIGIWLAGIALRIALVIGTVAVIVLQLSFMLEIGERFDVMSIVELEEEWLARIPSSANTQTGIFIILVALALLYMLTRRDYIEESILIIRSLGIQTSTSSPSYLGMAKTRFIPATQIQDIFIHEAFRGFEVRFYLAVIVEGEEDAVVVFPRLMPRRKLLEKTWRGTRQVLWGIGEDEFKASWMDA